MEAFGYLHLYAFNEQEEIGEITLAPGKGLAALVLTGAALFVGVQPSQAYAVRPGSVGPAVADLQVQLNQSGIPVAVDGVFGPQTLAAVLQLQTFYGLEPDGVVGMQTMQVLCNCGTPNGASVSNSFLPPDAYSNPAYSGFYSVYSYYPDVEKNLANAFSHSAPDNPYYVSYAPFSNVEENLVNSFNRGATNSISRPQQASVSQRLQRPQQASVPQSPQSESSVARSPQYYDVQPAAAPTTVSQETSTEPAIAQEFLAQEPTTSDEQSYVSEEQQMQEMLTQGQLEGRLW